MCFVRTPCLYLLTNFVEMLHVYPLASEMSGIDKMSEFHGLDDNDLMKFLKLNYLHTN